MLSVGQRGANQGCDVRLDPRAQNEQADGVESINEMEVTINLPEDILAALEGRWGNVFRRSREAIAVEAYRSGALNEGQVRRVLKFDTRFQVHALLKLHQVPLRYTAADLEGDLSAHRELGILPAR